MLEFSVSMGADLFLCGFPHKYNFQENVREEKVIF